ncbi:hypothetical protein JB92DRAFT_2874875 [Gautieria morchelliformis]|nr:hypothetical protein JB92DRAFT_2874875 [Gautieria morchelliformis]
MRPLSLFSEDSPNVLNTSLCRSPPSRAQPTSKNSSPQPKSVASRLTPPHPPEREAVQMCNLVCPSTATSRREPS